MADDTKVFRLTWVFDGKQFTADLNQAALNAVQQTGKVEDSDIQLTNITISNATKRVSAKKAESDAVSQAVKAQLSATNQAASAFPASTERSITSSSKLTSTIISLGRAVDPVGATFKRTSDAIAKASDIIERNGEASTAGAEATKLLVAALANATEAQQMQLAKLDSARKAGIITDQKYLDLQKQIASAYNVSTQGLQKQAMPVMQTPATVGQPQLPNANQQQFTASVQQTTTALDQELSALEDLAVGAGKVRDSLDPIRVIQRNLGEELSNLDNLLSKNALSFGEYVEANNRATEASKRLTEAVADKAFNQAGFDAAKNGLDVLTTKYDQATASARMMVGELAQLEAARKEGLVTDERYLALQSQIIQSYDLQAQAVKKAAEAQAELIASAKSEQFAQNAQGAFNTQLGVKDPNDPNTTKSARDSAAAFEEQMSAMEALATSAQKVRDSLNPVGVIERQLAEDQKALTETFIKSDLSLNEYRTAYQNLTNAAKVKIFDASGAKEANDDFDRLTAAARGLERELNPLIDVQTKYRERIAQINEIQSVGLGTSRAVTDQLADFIAKEAAVSAAIDKANSSNLSQGDILKNNKTIIRQAQNDFVDFGSSSNKAFGFARAGLLELQAAGVNTFQSLAAGISPLRTLTTEGAQVAGGFIQAGFALRTLIAFVAPLLVLGAAIAALGVRFLTVTNNIRDFQSQLSVFGSSTGVTTKFLQDTIDNLKQFSVGADDAKKAVTGLIHLAPQGLIINPDNIKIITELGAEIAKINQTNPADEIIALAKALTGGAEAIRKYSADNGVFLNQEGKLRKEFAGQAADMARINDTNKLAAILIGTLSGKYTEAARNSHVFTNEINTLTGYFVKLLDVINNWVGSGITKLVHAFESFGETIKSIYNTLTPFFDKVNQFFNKIPSLSQTNINTPVSPSQTGVQISAPIPTASSNNNIIETAKSFLGQNDQSATLRTFVQQSSNLDPRTAAWCAAFANAVLATNGIAGTGSNIATSFLNFGQPVSGAVQQGDVAVIPRGHTEGETGGHVGFATGATRTTSGGAFQIEVVSGNSGGAVQSEFRNAQDIVLRRANTSASAAGATTAGANTATTRGQFVGPSDETIKSINAFTAANEDALKKLSPLGAEARATAAWIDRYNEAVSKNIDPIKADVLGHEAYINVLKQTAVEAGHTLTVQDLETSGQMRSAVAYGETETAGLRSVAVEKALVDQLLQGIPAREAANSALRKSASDAILSSNQQLAASAPLLIRQEALANAALEGAKAEHEQTLQNEAAAISHESLIKAKAALEQAVKTGTNADQEQARTLVDLAQKEDAVALAQARRASIASQETEIGHTLQTNKDQTDVLALQVTLQGQTTEEITKQVALLQLRQQIGEKFNDVSQDLKDKFVASSTALQDWNIRLAEAQRAAERLSQLFVSIGETISNTLGQAITDAFSGKTITDWKQRLSDAISSIMNNIAQFAFIRPLIGTALTAIGFNQAAQTFGGFGSLVGGGIGQTATGAVTPGAGTQSALGIAGQAGGILQNLFSGGTGGSAGGLFSSGGIGNFVNNTIGGNLGFATSLSSAELADLGIPGSSALTIPGSLFGSTSLSSVLGGGAIGLGAGGLLSSLLGGNKVIGSAGGAAGGILGGLLGPLLGATGPIGGIVGGLLGGLTSLFGNNKPSNNAAGTTLSLGGRQATVVNSVASDQQSTQTVQQISQAIQAFIQQTTNLAGGAIGGTIGIQAGTRDGIKVGFSGAIGSGTQQYADAQSAINDIELKVAHNLTGISDNLKNVLANITDPAQAQSAITFAIAYDNLKKAADSAFSSISTDTQQIGPFQQALESINSTFADLSNTASQFGESLDPINAALAEATRRLQQDFGTSLDQALNTAAAKDYVNQLLAISDAFKSNTKEAQAIGLGGDTDTTNKINRLEVLNAQNILTTLSNSQLTDLIAQLGDSAPEISALAQSIIDSGRAATDATQSFTTLADGIKAIVDVANSLKTGTLSGLTEAAAANAALSQYQQSLSAAQSAGSNVTGNQLSTLSTNAQTAIEAFQAAYGNAPQTASTRKQIISDLDAIMAVANQAQAAIANVATALVIPASVQSAQDTVRTQALGGTASQAAAVSTPSTPTVEAPSSPMAEAAASASSGGGGTPTLADVGQAATLPAGSFFRLIGSDDLYQSTVGGGYNDVGRAAKGMASTPPGRILVGEVGPEWMGLPSFAMGTRNWKQVGRFGPEIINQSGGATILPFPIHPRNVSLPSFADGTTDFKPTMHPDIRPNVLSNNMSNDVVVEIRALRTDNQRMATELSAIKKQIQGGQVQAATDAKLGNTKLTSIEGKIGSPLITPPRRAVK